MISTKYRDNKIRRLLKSYDIPRAVSMLTYSPWAPCFRSATGEVGEEQQFGSPASYRAWSPFSAARESRRGARLNATGAGLSTPQQASHQGSPARSQMQVRCVCAYCQHRYTQVMSIGHTLCTQFKKC